MPEKGMPEAAMELGVTLSSDNAEHARDPWERLSAASARSDSDPELQASIEEAINAYQALRGVTVAIATRYRNLMDAIPDPLTIFDEDGKILLANAAACAIYGYEHDDLIQRCLRDITPSLASDHVSSVLEASRHNQTVVTEALATRSDGTHIPLEVHSRRFTDDGETRVISLGRDLREKQGKTERRTTSDARLRTLIQELDKGVVVQDATGQITSCNSAACRMFGHSEHEMLSRESQSFQRWQFVDDAGRTLHISKLPAARALSSGSPVAATMCGIFFPKQQAFRWLSVAAVPEFIDGETQPFQVVSFLDDVSAIKREAELYSQTQVLANIGGWQLDFATDALVWTAHMYTIFDLPETTSMTVDRMSRFFHADDRKRFRKMLLDAKTGTLSELELRVTSSIGRRRWVRMVARPVHHDNYVYGLIGTLQDVTERRRIEDNLQKKITTDALTGLPNRDAILESITRSIANAVIGDGPCLLFLNLDRFRSVNDQLGFGIGDQLLKAASERLLKRLPPEAELARFAGDEFMVLMPPGSNISHCETLAGELGNEFELPFKAGDHDFRLSSSIGMACHPDDGVTAQQLIAHAGAAMTEAKRRGRNNWQRFSADLARRASNRMRIEHHLQNAIARDEMRLEFQPQIDVRDGRVRGAEALLRWHSSELGELRPDLFVPLAETSGTIVSIGEWAIREACRQMRRWRDEGIVFERMAVNISYAQILSGNLVNTVISALRESQLPGEALELELTERVLVEDNGESQQTFAMLQGLGVKLVIDDFGEGYSALGYLRRLPVDGLKISHHFMQNVPSDATDTAICEAIIRIAKSLGLLIVVEGIETKAQCEFLIEHDTQLAQGHLFSRALKPEAFATFVREHNVSSGSQATRTA